jgi:hypothetical protein
MTNLRFLHLQSSYTAEKSVAEYMATEILTLDGIGLGNDFWVIERLGDKIRIHQWNQRQVIFRLAHQMTHGSMSEDYEVSASVAQ